MVKHDYALKLNCTFRDVECLRQPLSFMVTAHTLL